MPDPLKIEVNGTLDLHQFDPRDTPDLLSEFIWECHSKRISQGKIIHGKGIGTLKKIVHSKLKENHLVKAFWQADETSGGWGATLFSLHYSEGVNESYQDA